MAIGRIAGEFSIVRNDPREIFVQAEEFHNACRLLGRFAVLHGRNVGMPSSLCSAFALELYLKCLLAIEGKAIPTIHNLEKLFNRISSLNQERIRSYFTSKAPEMAQFFATVNREMGWTMMPSAPDFDQQLKASADAFVQARYLYERPKKVDHPTGYFAYPIEEGARNAILQIHPEWKGARRPYP